MFGVEVPQPNILDCFVLKLQGCINTLMVLPNRAKLFWYGREVGCRSQSHSAKVLLGSGIQSFCQASFPLLGQTPFCPITVRRPVAHRDTQASCTRISHRTFQDLINGLEPAPHLLPSCTPGWSFSHYCLFPMAVSFRLSSELS